MEKQPIRWAFANQKGGVAKTTTCVNLATALQYAGKRVLVVDADPQANASTALGVVGTDNTGLAAVLLGESAAEQIVIGNDGIAVLAGSPDLALADFRLREKSEREYQLKNALLPIQHHYDAILWDCPPALNMLTVNALVAAHGVVIPMPCEYYALEGLSRLVETVQGIQSYANPVLHIVGIVRTLYDRRSRLSEAVSQQLRNHFGSVLCETVIPRNVRLAEAPSHSLTGIAYDKRSSGARAYLSLADELCKLHQERG